MPEVLISFSWATLARKYPLSVRSIATIDSATWCRTFAAASAARRLRPEVSKNSSTALSSNEGELARSITTCVPAMASLSPSPVTVLIPLRGEAATTSWPPWRRMATVFEPIRPVPPITTIFMVDPPLSMTGDRPAGEKRDEFALPHRSPLRTQHQHNMPRGFLRVVDWSAILIDLRKALGYTGGASRMKIVVIGGSGLWPICADQTSAGFCQGTRNE